MQFVTYQNSNNWDSYNNQSDSLKNGTVWFFSAVMRLKDADVIASV